VNIEIVVNYKRKYSQQPWIMLKVVNNTQKV